MQISSILFLNLLRGGWANPDPPHSGYSEIRFQIEKSKFFIKFIIDYKYLAEYI